MSDFKVIKPKDLKENPFKLIGQDWMLITAERDQEQNTMTAAWGGLGVMWGKDVAYIVVRPQRYTREFIDSSDGFSLCFFDEEYSKTLSYIGTVSGRYEDKIKKAQLSIIHEDTIPYFEEAKIAIICKKLYAQNFMPECFMEGAKNLEKKWYPEQDYHILYIAEIQKILVKK